MQEIPQCPRYGWGVGNRVFPESYWFFFVEARPPPPPPSTKFSAATATQAHHAVPTRPPTTPQILPCPQPPHPTRGIPSSTPHPSLPSLDRPTGAFYDARLSRRARDKDDGELGVGWGGTSRSYGGWETRQFGRAQRGCWSDQLSTMISNCFSTHNTTRQRNDVTSSEWHLVTISTTTIFSLRALCLRPALNGRLSIIPVNTPFLLATGVVPRSSREESGAIRCHSTIICLHLFTSVWHTDRRTDGQTHHL